MKQVEWYVGGVSAGHIMPLRALAQQRRAQAPCQTRFIVADTPLDARLTRDMPEVDRLTILRSRGIGARSIGTFARACGALALDLIAVARLMYRERPSVVITTGGGVALSVVLIARLLVIPVHAYELDAVPGRMIRVSRWLGCQIYCVFTQAMAACGSRARHVAYPLYRRAIPLRHDSEPGDYSRNAHGLRVVILGGSQGSGWLNRTMPVLMARVMADIPDITLNVIHQAGAAADDVMHRYQQACPDAAERVHVIEYEPHVDRLYRAAHIVICRAGSGTHHELDAWHVPTLVIPLPHAVTDHQQANAQAWCARSSHDVLGTAVDRVWMAQEDLTRDAEPLVAWLMAQARAWQYRGDQARAPHAHEDVGAR